MKVKLGKLLGIAGRLIVAAPAIIEAVRPVIDGAKRRKRPTTPEPSPARVDQDGAPAVPSHPPVAATTRA